MDVKTNQQGICRLFLMAVLFVAGSHFALAQVQASISGRIEDSSGAAIPGAAAIVTNLETGATRTMTTDEAGNYREIGRASCRERV